MLDSSLCYANANDTNKKVIFKNCTPFTNSISEVNNTQVDNAKRIDIIMPMYNVRGGLYIQEEACGNIV